MSSVNEPQSAACSGGASEMPPALRGRAYWRSIEEQAASPQFQRWVNNEFQEGASELSADDRRTFIKLMGASFALAGLTLSGCRRWPETNIVPFAGPPSDRAPGTAIQYATTVAIRGTGIGILAKSYDGRPIKVDGNGKHPSGSGSTPITQAFALEIYDPERSREILNYGATSSSLQFDGWLGGQIKHWRADGGQGLAFLSETLSGPSAIRLRDEVLAAFPNAIFTEFEPSSDETARVGTAAAFGAAKRVLNDYSRARVIVALDCDFLAGRPEAVADIGAFAAARRADNADPKNQDIARLYAVEPGLSLTGINADERITARACDVAALAAHIAAACGVDSPGVAALAAKSPHLLGDDAKRLELMVADLKSHRGSGLVVAGDRQGAVVHALVAAINQVLGNCGSTVSYGAVRPASNGPAGISALAKSIEGGTVKCLVTIGGNPAYDAPAELGFAALLAKIPQTIRLSLRNDETSRAGEKGATWQLPRAHFLEAWNDTQAADGTLAIAQPLIAPLLAPEHGGWNELELLSRITGHEATSSDIVRATHGARTGLAGTDFDLALRGALDVGAWPSTASTPETRLEVSGAAVSDLALLAATAIPAADSLEVTFHFDNKVDDGRYGNLAWLQELPDSVTKITWDNALLLSPTTAAALGISSGDMLHIEAAGRAMDAAAWILPGHADGTFSIALGYGRGDAAGTIASGAGFNAYALRVGGAGFITGAKVTRTGATYEFAHTQDHGAANALVPSVIYGGIQDRLPSLIREGTLEEYRANPSFASGRVHKVHNLSLWEESNLDGAQFRWAMSIDLSACTGCSACVTACQSENNIPVVGKGQVMRGREMFWIRVDRYFKGRDPNRPTGYAIQPVTCMQCENAPCEQVCPVGATSHDKDGLNSMTYNRCIGTRYCSNNCPYKVRRFNYFDWNRREPTREEGFWKTSADYYTSEGSPMWLRMQFNPEVTVRMRGVMEKCTFCTQRIQAAKITNKNAWAKSGGAATGAPNYTIPDGAIVTACQQACPAGAIVFGDLNDPVSKVSLLQKNGRAYQMLEELNTKPRVKYLARITNPSLPVSGADAHHPGDSHDGAQG